MGEKQRGFRKASSWDAFELGACACLGSQEACIRHLYSIYGQPNSQKKPAKDNRVVEDCGMDFTTGVG